MQTRDITQWETSISEVVSSQDDEDIVIRGRPLNELIGQITFTDVMFLMLQGRLPTDAERHVLDALLVASVEHGIAPPSMIARCYASYGTTIQAAVGAGVSAFGDDGWPWRAACQADVRGSISWVIDSGVFRRRN